VAILKEDIIKQCEPGDILLTCNPAGLGKLINFGQGLEDEGRKSKYGHIAIFAKHAGSQWITNAEIFESVTRISKNSIDKYHEQDICVIRHTGMTPERFYKGREEILDNLGQIYPFHRLAFHGLDMVNSWIKRVIFRRKALLKFRYMNFMPLDWPVCSELGTQFLHTSGLKGGWEDIKKGWRGVNPDDFDDARVTRTDLWSTILEDQYIDITKIK
jgi:hypothetical protein